MATKRKSDALSEEVLGDDVRLEASLRPQTFDEYVGQDAVVEKLKVYVRAASQRRDALDHCLFSGPPGLGKTSLAHIIASELGVGIHVTSGPALERKGDLAGLLTNLNERDVLFIDEIHRLNAAVEEYLYPAMEDFRLDITIDTGPAARAMKIDLPPFTLIGATTRTGLLTSPLRDRFQIQERLDYYEPKYLEMILNRSARILGVPLDRDASKEISTRSRGTPRISNRLLRRLRDFAQVEGEGRITQDLAHVSLDRLGVDASGLDSMDRKILLTIIDKFGGGPVGVETIAASVGEQRDSIEDVYEPYLLQEGFLQRTPRGRMATHRAYGYFKRAPPPASPQGSLF
ncbi:Holliday junction branch migration DNA helicase RuvB [Stigmatella sp. ncwal1]|uniref:Holliday junction branch migration complex subunit RuvB n=1 Tax=Stigmatella ashevillensis TaxID=2995309 RepID=A0ABT5D621_9BACT|nr:Holliday junction branch migration DNA helicase RuvB [Stigmatella ashevillena]MDC0709103.1 Holliday junction branch migration DNA helicase RuvB [Stigmatella ashevillena]